MCHTVVAAVMMVMVSSGASKAYLQGLWDSLIAQPQTWVAGVIEYATIPSIDASNCIVTQCEQVYHHKDAGH